MIGNETTMQANGNNVDLGNYKSPNDLIQKPIYTVK